MAVLRLDNVGIAVRDAAASHAFFARIPGLTPGELRGSTFTVPVGGASLFVFETDSVSAGDVRSTNFGSNPRGLDHLALEVADIDAASTQFEAAGIRFEGGIWGDAGEFRYRGFKDPDGNMLYIIQHGPGAV